jgi:hypothetical protein
MRMKQDHHGDKHLAYGLLIQDVLCLHMMRDNKWDDFDRGRLLESVEVHNRQARRFIGYMSFIKSRARDMDLVVPAP